MFNKKRFNLVKIISLIWPLYFLSCSEKDKDLIITNISPVEFQTYKNANEIVEFDINTQSNISNINSFKITLKEDSLPLKILLDTSLNSKNFRYYLLYKCGSFKKRKKFIFTFVTTNTEGNSFYNVRNLTVLEDSSLLDRPLIETTSNVLFSKHSGDPKTAFDLQNLAPLTQGISDQQKMDLADTSNNEVLGRLWRSFTGATFVKANGFDYPNAKISDLINTYKSSIKTPVITNLQEGDIILIYCPPPRNIYSAIRISRIKDLEGSANDSYEFSVKK
jgi:hypothetical protein